ncbi:tRNA (guanosine(46)-N7)-methyltransferase TrmB [Prochlorococcus sp. MIT 1307]|uniref:tRNA (guanosine(46)-N7)-methyltransferase TrmB n=1 Tax=Prochlorococcus sp. MIT 1307 TaxID=3096219 RepID=UPI002A750A7A|nr:tRNA (guanosine(46)-N7)-methyltransferase TrmB [Prochlorococcus sp. MIT 1307]
MRQHVNPLSSFFQLPLELPGPSELFENAELPMHLDIGSARGKFLLEMASLQPDWNYLGVEIRKTLVDAAERDRNQLGLKNLRFIFCNANVSLDSWLSDLPINFLARVSIQFPDPWFKRRHKKRRVLQPRLLISLAKSLGPGCELFIQSDILNVIESMTSLVELSKCFNRSEDSSGIWLEKNPFPVKTERENYVLANSLPVYRALYIRNSHSLPDLQRLNLEYQLLKN